MPEIDDKSLNSYIRRIAEQDNRAERRSRYSHPAEEGESGYAARSVAASDEESTISEGARRKARGGRADASQQQVRDGGLIDVVKQFFGGDKVLWVIIAALMIISVLVVYSSTAKMALSARSALTTMAFLRSQLFYLAISIVALIVTHKIDSRIFKKYAFWGWIFWVGATAAAYVIGSKTNDAARWIDLGFIRLQPSEFLKIAFIVYLARHLSCRQNTIVTMQIVPSYKFWTWLQPKQLRIFKTGGKIFFLPIVITCGVIVFAHTSSAVIVFLLSIFILFVGRVRLAEIAKLVGWAVIGLSLMMILGMGRSSTAQGRLSTFWDLWTTDRTEIPIEDLSDTERSMIGIYNGGLLGQGAGQSAVRVEMTHPESDYAFAFFVEEYGIGLAIVLIALYVWIFFRAIDIFERCPKKFPAILSLGIALLITGQALLHIMVTINLIPETGQTLPLISRGGSSLIAAAVGLGMILSVSRQNIEGSHSDD